MASSLYETIWSGNVWKDEEHMLNLRNKFLENLDKRFTSSQHITDLISKTTSDDELLQLFKPCFEWSAVSDKIAQTFKKCSTLSTQFRECGNHEYKNGNKTKALRAYNLAIVFAPTNGTEELALGFGNRSAVFAQMNEWKLAIQDIDLAIEHGIPDHLLEKLQQRRQKCLNSFEVLKLQSTQTRATQTQQESDHVNNITKHMFTLHRPNPIISCAEDFVEISYDVKCGRKLVSTRDVDAGTVLCVEQSYVTVLEKELEWDLAHCHNCYRQILGGIPCAVCTFATFCDRNCLTAAMHSSHQFDHLIFPYFHSHEVLHYSDLMSLRIITKTGPTSLHQKYLSSDYTKKIGGNGTTPTSTSTSTPSIIDPRKIGFNNEGIYESSYHQIYNLFGPNAADAKSWTTDMMNEFVSNIFKAFVLSSLLFDLTTFFTCLHEGLDEDEVENLHFRDFITTLLFHHLGNIKFNAMSFSEILKMPSTTATKETPTTTRTTISHTFAVGLFPTLSLVNHSCAPNTIHIRNTCHCVTSLVALQPIHAGDEITITYGPKFQLKPTLERQTELENKFQFKCACQACRPDNNWSPESVIPSVDEGIDLELIQSRCPQCTTQSNTNQRHHRHELKCTNCLATLLTINTQLDQYEDELRELYTAIKDYENNFLRNSKANTSLSCSNTICSTAGMNGDMYWKTIERLKPCLQFFGAHFKPTYSLTQIGQDLFKKVVVQYVMAMAMAQNATL